MTPPNRPLHPVDVLVGDNLRKIREAKGMTVETLAAAVGQDRWQIAAYELGAVPTSPMILHQLSLVLRVQPLQLFRTLSECQ